MYAPRHSKSAEAQAPWPELPDTSSKAGKEQAGPGSCGLCGEGQGLRHRGVCQAHSRESPASTVRDGLSDAAGMKPRGSRAEGSKRRSRQLQPSCGGQGGAGVPCVGHSTPTGEAEQECEEWPWLSARMHRATLAAWKLGRKLWLTLQVYF